MDVCQWLLFFICICVKVTQTQASSWTIDVPSSVKGLLGSCVVIPCSYNYPDAKVHTFTGIWTNDGNQVIYHPTESKMLEQYRRRTKLLGDISKSNCSLMIENLQQSDGGPFHFRIELGGYNSFSYLNKKVSVSMIREPNAIDFSAHEDIKEGETVNASCSVYHSCPTYPPAFHWSHSGEQHFQAQKHHDGQWKATSILKFRSNRTDHNKLLQCRVTYHGGKHQETSKTLKVKYAPVNVKVEHQSDVNEGQTVHLKCSSDANPVSSYEWHSETGALLYKGQTYTMSNVSRHSIQSMYCTAVNEEGRDRSSTVQLNVLYAPDIRTYSKCSSYNGIVKCDCIVESRPPSMVHFVLGDRVLQSSNVETAGSVTTGTLQTDFGSFKFVHCLANNTLGHANLTLSLPVNDNMQNIFIASGTGVILLIILIATAVGVKKCTQRSGEPPPSDLSTMKSERPVEIPHYAPARRKENYEDAHCNYIYTNYHVYGNVGTDWDESVYANV